MMREEVADGEGSWRLTRHAGLSAHKHTISASRMQHDHERESRK